jgi:long-chain acyl-CoA synthetase
VSECSPVISVTRLGEQSPPGSAGPIYPGVEVKIVGSDGSEVADGEVGEVWVRGPNVMKGYYGAPDQTAKVLNEEGWFNTQDLARLKHGQLYIVGRTKELIIRFGFNVYPAEVEEVLNGFPGVELSAVIGRTALETGEQEVIAFVKLTEGSSATAADIARFAGQNLAPYKRPSEVRIVSQLPMTVSGKVIKDQLAKALMGEGAQS